MYTVRSTPTSAKSTCFERQRTSLKVNEDHRGLVVHLPFFSFRAVTSWNNLSNKMLHH